MDLESRTVQVWRNTQNGVLSGWVHTVLRALEPYGIPLEQAVFEARIDPEILLSGESRYSQADVNRLWVYARQKAQDPSFGLTVAKHVRPASFHVVGQAMSCSITLYRALQRLCRYCRLLSDATTATLIDKGDTVRLEFYFDMGKRPPVYQSHDTVLASVLFLMRWIACLDIKPTDVALRYDSEHLPDGFAEFFQCNIRLGQIQDSISFLKSDLEQRVPSSDERLALLLDEVASKDLDERMAGRFTLRVRDALIAQIAEGSPSKLRTAEILHMTQRTLLRRLKEEGVTYVSVLNQLREEMAFNLLNHDNIPLIEISQRLGFSDYTTFSRAFTRWTGARPSQHIGRSAQSSKSP
jgi:AraC-like DNA-binding protein